MDHTVGLLCNDLCFSGLLQWNKGLYLSAITEALDIPRSLFSVNDSFRYVSSALISLFFGPLLYKFGVRKMVTFGFLCLVGSLLLYAVSLPLETLVEPLIVKISLALTNRYF